MYVEDKKSIELMQINSKQINNKELDRKSDKKLIWNYFKRVAMYLLMGEFGYAYFAVKRAFLVAINKEQCDVSAARTRNIAASDRIAVYSVLFGNYDCLKEPMYISDRCDYYILTDQEIPASSTWKKYDLGVLSDMESFSNLEKARYCKLHPHLLFPEYKYSIFIDANIQIVTDLVPIVEQLGDNFIAIHNQPGRDCVYQEATEIIVIKKAPKEQVIPQVKAYKAEGFPKHYDYLEPVL